MINTLVTSQLVYVCTNTYSPPEEFYVKIEKLIEKFLWGNAVPKIAFQTLQRQESPPAWTQEAYCPPRSHGKCLLFKGGVLWIPPQTWDGVPPQTWDGVPPHLDLGWGTPPGPGMGYPPTWTWDGVPPPTWTWDGTPLPRTEMGYPPYPDLRWDTPPPPQMWTDWNYYLPPSFGWRAVKIRRMGPKTRKYKIPKHQS